MAKQAGKKPIAVITHDAPEKINLKDYNYVFGNGPYFNIQAEYDSYDGQIKYFVDIYMSKGTLRNKHLPDNFSNIHVKIPKENIKCYKSKMLDEYYLTSAFTYDANLSCTLADGTTQSIAVSDLNVYFSSYRQFIKNHPDKTFPKTRPTENYPMLKTPIPKEDAFRNLPSKFFNTGVCNYQVRVPSDDDTMLFKTIVALPVDKSISDDGFIRTYVTYKESPTSPLCKDIMMFSKSMSVSRKLGNHFVKTRMLTDEVLNSVYKERYKYPGHYNETVQSFSYSKMYPNVNKYSQNSWLLNKSFEINKTEIAKTSYKSILTARNDINEAYNIIPIPRKFIEGVCNEITLEKEGRQALILKLHRNANPKPTGYESFYVMLPDKYSVIQYAGIDSAGKQKKQYALVVNKKGQTIICDDFGNDYSLNYKQLENFINDARENEKEVRRRFRYVSRVSNDKDKEIIKNAKKLLHGISPKLIDGDINSSKVTLHLAVPNSISEANVIHCSVDRNKLIEYHSDGFYDNKFSNDDGRDYYIYASDKDTIDFVDANGNKSSVDIDKLQKAWTEFKETEEYLGVFITAAEEVSNEFWS